MYRAYPPRSHQTPYGVHRFHRTQPTVIRYPRAGYPHRSMLMQHPKLSSPLPPPPPDGVIGLIGTGLLALLCCVCLCRKGKEDDDLADIVVVQQRKIEVIEIGVMEIDVTET